MKTTLGPLRQFGNTLQLFEIPGSFQPQLPLSGSRRGAYGERDE
jgi:hypothetical protein